jgi:hypothetical protein
MPERGGGKAEKTRSLARVPLHRMLLFFLYLKRIRRHYAATLFTISVQAARLQSAEKSHSLKARVVRIKARKAGTLFQYTNVPPPSQSTHSPLAHRFESVLPPLMLKICLAE